MGRAGTLIPAALAVACGGVAGGESPDEARGGAAGAAADAGWDAGLDGAAPAPVPAASSPVPNEPSFADPIVPWGPALLQGIEYVTTPEECAKRDDACAPSSSCQQALAAYLDEWIPRCGGAAGDCSYLELDFDQDGCLSAARTTKLPVKTSLACLMSPLLDSRWSCCAGQNVGVGIGGKCTT